MPHLHQFRSLLLPLAISCVYSGHVIGADPEMALDEEVLIEIDDAGAPGEIVIEDTPDSGSAGEDLLIIEDSTPVSEDATPLADPESKPEPKSETGGTATAWADKHDVKFGVDDLWLEYGHFARSAAAADNSTYGKIEAFANWKPDSAWELQVAGRVDGYGQYGGASFNDLKADYSDSFVRYRADDLILTLGTQTVIWGRLDELPLANRVSTADLTRFILDDLTDRTRANPMARAEAFVGPGKLDLVWLFDFRAAVMPDKESVWYPINQQTGRVLGFSPKDVPPASVKNADISDDAPSGDGGFGARYTFTHTNADIGLTIADTRQSIPYFRSAGAGRLEAVYPRSWAYGADTAIDAAGATWRAAILYSSDNPVTRTNLSYTTAPAISWGGGVEFHPGDRDTRVNLQLVGKNIFDAPQIIDQERIYSINGEIETPFDRNRWRAKLGFYFGLGEKNIYLEPEIAFLGWEPHEIYLAGHYFDGDDNTFGGFYENNSSINLGWRTKF